MSAIVIAGGDVITPFELIEDGAVVVRDGRIERVCRRAELGDIDGDEIDARGGLICPGFVDLQVNGGGGAMLTDQPGPGAVAAMTSAHVRGGTTALLATVVTAEEERMAKALAAARDAVERPASGARVVGSHLEGPFLSPARRGAHPERDLRAPDRELLARLIAAAGGSLRLLTLAPELPGAHELLVDARAAGAAVSIGHSDATYDEARAALDAGATFGTHVFNGMRPLAQREPGIIGALLSDERAVCGLIADGVHVHPANLALVHRAKGPDGVALVTDAVATPGDPTDALRARGVEVRDGACYLADGTLAGSALMMNTAVRNMRDLAGVPLVECVRMATATPARVLGLENEIGVLRAGARADVVTLDRELNVQQVFVGGEPAASTGSA